MSTLSAYKEYGEGAEVVYGPTGEKFYLVYNDQGSAVTNGDVYVLDFAKDADSLSPSVFPTLTAPATNASALQMVAVVNNSIKGKSTIADQEWGYVQVEGWCDAIKAATGGVTIEQYLEVLNAGTGATDDGASITTKSFGICKETAVAAATFKGYLFGQRVVVAGS